MMERRESRESLPNAINNAHSFCGADDRRLVSRSSAASVCNAADCGAISCLLSGGPASRTDGRMDGSAACVLWLFTKSASEMKERTEERFVSGMPLRALLQRVLSGGEALGGNLRHRSSESVSRLSLRFPSPLLSSPPTISSIIWTERRSRRPESISLFMLQVRKPIDERDE